MILFEKNLRSIDLMNIRVIISDFNAGLDSSIYGNYTSSFQLCSTLYGGTLEYFNIATYNCPLSGTFL